MSGDQPFSVACPEGHRLSGLRTEGYQALRCPTCGEGIFVLPRSPLPAPAVSRSPAAPVDRSWSGVIAPGDDDPITLKDPIASPVFEAMDEPITDGEVEWLDESSAIPSIPEVEGQGPRTQGADATAARSERPAGAAAPTRQPRPEKGVPATKPRPVTTPAAAPRLVVSPWERVRGNRNVLIFLGVTFLVIGTVAFRTWRVRRQELPRIAELGRVEGLAALDSGQFDRAHQLLSQAKHAVASLGDAYQGAAAIRQGADEAEIISQLVPDPLEDLLDQAARADPKDWSTRFDTLYRGRAVILDAHVAAVPDPLGNGHYELDYRIFREGEGVPRSLGRVDTSDLALIALLKPRVGDRITLGARLASFRYDDQRNEWLVGLEPASGVVMTHVKALEALGWPRAGENGGEEQP